MSHYHLEVIMPPQTDIISAIDSIMLPFDENRRGEEDHSGHDFWDWYVIGGRWAGTKESCRYDAGKLEEFYKWLQVEKITVAGLQCGKQALQPKSQIPKVDAMWNELFPTEDRTVTPCPLFARSLKQPV